MNQRTFKQPDSTEEGLYDRIKEKPEPEWEKWECKFVEWKKYGRHRESDIKYNRLLQSLLIELLKTHKPEDIHKHCSQHISVSTIKGQAKTMQLAEGTAKQAYYSIKRNIK